jgi:hypothetical protein
MAIKCEEVVKKNFGRSRCNTLPNLPSGMITTDDDVVIPAATLADSALLLAFLNAQILLGKAWYWPPFASFENISQEAVYEDSPLAYLPVIDGNYRFRFGISENICIHKAMYSHRSLNQGRVIIIDKKNQLLMTETADGDGTGLSMQMLHTEKFIFNDGSVSTKSPVLVALQNNLEIDSTGFMVVFPFVSQLYRIVDVALVIDEVSGSEITVTVTAECDGTPILGLGAADFVLTNEAGADVPVVATEEGEGVYTLTGSIVDGTLTLETPTALTIKAYDGEEVVVAVPS